MKNYRLLNSALFLLLAGIMLTYIGISVNGTWRENIKNIGSFCLLIAGILGLLIALNYKLSEQEE